MTQSASPILPLFRQEAINARSDIWMGAIRLAQPTPTWIISVVSLVIAGLLICYVCLGSVTRKAHVAGVTVPIGGNISIASPSSGILLQNHVREGDLVEASQPLFTVSSERRGSSGEITALIAQQLASRKDTLQTEARLRHSSQAEKRLMLNQRLGNLVTETEQAAHEIELAKRRYVLAQKTLEKFETLSQSGYVSAAQVQQKQEEVIDNAARLSSLERSKTQLEAARISLQAELAALTNGLETDLTQIERAKASLEQEIAENTNRNSVVITAPHAGIVTAITYQSGQAINASQILATLIPSNCAVAPRDRKVSADSQSHRTTCAIDDRLTALEAHLYAPSRTAGFVAPGQQVLIRYSAFPYQKFGLHPGVVTDVSKTPFAPTELPQHLASTIMSGVQQSAGGAPAEGLYRITVKLDRQTISAYDKNQVLKPGMTLEADIIQDRRRIWEWIAEPLLSVTQPAFPAI